LCVLLGLLLRLDRLLEVSGSLMSRSSTFSTMMPRGSSARFSCSTICCATCSRAAP
jgi:hypothetical protein